MYCHFQVRLAMAPDPHGTDASGKPQGSADAQGRGGKPSREPGDVYVIACALLGVVLGVAVGLVVSRGIGGLIIAILCVAGGALLGGSVGALLGEKLRTRIAGRRRGPRGEDSE